MNTSTPARTDVSLARRSAAIAVSLALQFSASLCAYGALDRLVIDFSSFSGRPNDSSTSWTIFPLAIAVPVLWLSSGGAASRVARDPRYWATSLIGPIALFLLWVVAG